MDGILLIDKPLGLTSHDVVGQVRRAARMKKVGHAGTLDPLATGLLVVALGQATRTLEYLTGHDKVYEATVRLGQSTTTYDAEGDITSEYVGVLPSREQVEAALGSFQGTIWQTPPIYSALKVGGEALYEKARRGEHIEVAPREITIYHLALTTWAPPYLGLSIHCSKGTYIRSIANDLGVALAVGGHLTALRRTASGNFSLSNALALAKLAAASVEEIERMLLPVGVGLEALPSLVVDDSQISELRYGRALPGSPMEGVVRAVDQNGRLVAFLHWREGRGWQPDKVFA